MARLLRIVWAVFALGLLVAPSFAEMTEAERQEIEGVIRDYLLANPELIEEAIGVLRQRREAEEAAARVAAIEENRDTIFSSPNQMVLGNAEGPITLVEFFDYNCSYCRRATSDMTALIDANPDLRVVMKEFPILSEGSVEAARFSIAVKNIAPEHYLDFHLELFSRPGEATAAKALEIAGDLGLDVEALTAAAKGEDVSRNLQEVQELAGKLGISGTPSYVIGDELVPGAAGYDTLQAMVTAMRECEATVC
jgi:protein-disulfide isomerase